MKKYEEIIKNYNEEELNILKNNLNNYIVPLSNIEWLHLSGDELIVFLNNNYINNNEKIEWKYRENMYNVLGMNYLSFNNICKGFKYIIGVIPNNINKKTIVCIACLSNDYELFEGERDSHNKIYYIETNILYQEHGIFHLLVDEILKDINYKKGLIFNDETKIGMHYHCYNYIKERLQENNFNNDILEESDIDKEYMIKLGYHG